MILQQQPAESALQETRGPCKSCVNQTYKYIYARLQDDTFFSLDALNNHIWELLDGFVSRPYKDSSRIGIFQKEELPLMRPLPASMYRMCDSLDAMLLATPKLSACKHVSYVTVRK